MSEDEQIDGARIAAAILNRMPPERKARLIKQIAQTNPEIAQKIELNLVGINDIPDLISQSVQTLIREVERRDLIVSLRSADSAVRGAVLEQMPERARAILVEELAAPEELSPAEAQAAHARLVAKMEQLRAEGRIRSEAKSETWA